MRNYYTKFIEGDKKDLQRACRIFKKHGYSNSGVDFCGTGILMSFESNFFTTYQSETDLIRQGFIELTSKTSIIPTLTIQEAEEKFNINILIT